MKLFLFLFFISLSCFGQNTRWIDIEWEEVPGASQYEVELFEGEGQSQVARGKFKVDTSSWSNAVPPGKYSLRIRSLDKRGVPGEWSEHIPVKVRMHNPRLLFPGTDAKITQPQVEFEWTQEEGAAGYQLVIKNDKNRLVHNSIVKETRSSVYLEELGQYTWTAYALEEGEAQRSQDEFTSSSFKGFTRVGGELEPPTVKVETGDRIQIEWAKIRNAKFYQIDYQPPVNQDKNRRFKLSTSKFTFSSTKLREGVTTITIRSTAPGYPDSPGTIVMLEKSGNKVEVQDIIQPEKETPTGPHPSLGHWKNEVLISMVLAKYAYESNNSETDTELDQKDLTGAGLNLEWLNKPKMNSLQRRADLSFLQLSSGRESGSKLRFAFSLSKEKSVGKGKFVFGGGVNYLRLPAFLGNRFEDDIFVQYSSSLGPMLKLGYLLPVAPNLAFQATGVYAHQLFYLDSEIEDGKAFGWMNLDSRVLYYISKKEALFIGATYESWDQKWKSDKSSLTGFALLLGFRAGL